MGPWQAPIWGPHICPEDTSATCYPQSCSHYKRNQTTTQYVIKKICYCINIDVGTPGVALPVSVQSSCFLDDPPGYSFATLANKAKLTWHRGLHNPTPASNRLPHQGVHARFSRVQFRVVQCGILVMNPYLAAPQRTAIFRNTMYRYPYVLSSTLRCKWSPAFGSNASIDATHTYGPSFSPRLLWASTNVCGRRCAI